MAAAKTQEMTTRHPAEKEYKGHAGTTRSSNPAIEACNDMHGLSNGCNVSADPGGSMAYWATRYVSRSLGFALGWLYFYSFGILIAYEITAASIVISYWPNNIHIAVWITILLVVIIGLNLSPVGVFGETEFWFASIKVMMIIGLLIISLVLMLGGGPSHDRLGFRYWNDPGAVKAYLLDGTTGRFTAFLYVWVFAGFSYYFSPELIVVTGGEMRNPRKNLPIACRHFILRLAVFYGLGSLAIGVICDSTASGLTSGASNANASPWVIAIRNAGISVLPSIINAGILTSGWSAGNSYLYLSSRSLYSLSVAGNAPRIFSRCNRYGLPIYAVLASCCFAPLAYLNVSKQPSIVFNWFVSLTNTAGYTSWIVCAIIFLRFRKACKTQGVSVPYQSRIQPYAAWICIPLFGILLLANGFTVFYPGQFTVAGFLTTYLGIPIFLTLWLGHKLLRDRNSSWVHAPEAVDLVSGLREVEDEAHQWTLQKANESQRGKNGGQPYSIFGSSAWLRNSGSQADIPYHWMVISDPFFPINSPLLSFRRHVPFMAAPNVTNASRLRGHGLVEVCACFARSQHQPSAEVVPIRFVIARVLRRDVIQGLLDGINGTADVVGGALEALHGPAKLELTSDPRSRVVTRNLLDLPQDGIAGVRGSGKRRAQRDRKCDENAEGLHDSLWRGTKR
ncbi:hypothetical protein ACCO45_007590 [Purpureocillium lilacinum]|uniref:Uncharacterized protein n=1 Tax=Purpureocillium lilacinum TaxID=33203 RepID=A0ACC4DLP2_PURLI